MLPPLPKPSEAALVAASAYAGPWRWTSFGHTKVLDTEWNGYRVASFQGTILNGYDILRDIRFVPWWDRYGGFGPAGFVKGVQQVIEEMIADLIADARAQRLIFVGHSLGGAEALRAASHFAGLGAPPAAVFAFEPPRAGLLKLKRSLKKVPVFICHNGNSPVPYVPWLYRHPAKVTKIGRWCWEPIHCHRIAQIHADLVAAGL